MVITKEDRVCLDWAARTVLAEQVLSTRILQESDKKTVLESIKNELTYEQALNLALNNNREDMYVESDLLESIAMIKIIDFLDPTAKLGLMESKQETPEEPVVEMDITTASGKFALLESVLSEKSGIEYASGKLAQARKSHRSQAYGRGAVTTQVQKLKTAGRNIAAGKSTLTNKLKDAAGDVKIFVKRNPQLTKVAKWVGAGIAAALAAKFVYKKIFSKMGSKCNKFDGPAQQKCIAGVQASATQGTIAALKQAKSKCSESRNPSKCSAKYDKQIAIYSKRLAGYKAAAS